MGEVVIKTALDIGSSKVKAIIGELSGDGSRIRVVASTEVPSTGVRKAKVEDVESLSESIKMAVTSLEEKSGIPIKRVSIGVGGNHIKSVTRNIRHSFSDESEVIAEKHYEDLYTLAEKEIAPTESVIKKEIYNIRVDNSGILKNPVGIAGNNLEGDIHLITVEKAQQELLVEAVNRAGIEVEDITLNAYASAQSVLTRDDRMMGVALVDIGEGSTDIIIFKNDKLIYSKTIPIGGMHYINDISYMFKVNREDAFRVKGLYNAKKSEQSIKIKVDGEVKTFNTLSIREVLDARSGDIVNHLSKALEESGFKGYLGNGVILTGGATKMDEVVEELAKSLNYKVKIGNPFKIRGMEEALPSHSTVLGILLEVLEKEDFKRRNPEEVKAEEEVVQEEIPVEAVEEEKKPSEKKEVKKSKPEPDKPGVFDNIKSWIKEFI